jgi:hypothetical protein
MVEAGKAISSTISVTTLMVTLCFTIQTLLVFEAVPGLSGEFKNEEKTIPFRWMNEASAADAPRTRQEGALGAENERCGVKGSADG